MSEKNIKDQAAKNARHQSGANSPNDYNIRKKRYEEQNKLDVQKLSKQITGSFLRPEDKIAMIDRLIEEFDNQKKKIQEKLENNQ